MTEELWAEWYCSECDEAGESENSWETVREARREHTETTGHATMFTLVSEMSRGEE